MCPELVEGRDATLSLSKGEMCPELVEGEMCPELVEGEMCPELVEGGDVP